MPKPPRRAIIAAFVVAIIAVMAIDVAGLLFGERAAAGGMAAAVANVVLKLILGLFLLGMVQLFVKWEWARRFSGQIPSHLTALGILGTFIGIFVGLYNFEVDRLDLAVPLLLEGMKLAFSTSIAGLAASTVLRVSHSIAISIHDSDDPFKPRSEFQKAINEGRGNIAAAAMAGSGLTTEGLEFLILLTDDAFDRLMARMSRLREEIEQQIAELKRRTEALKRQTEEIRRHNEQAERAMDLGRRARER